MNTDKRKGAKAQRPTIHIFSAGAQKATNYLDATCPGRPMRFKNTPRELHQCSICYRMRQARNLEVRVYYDDHRFTCIKGKGCQFDK